MDFDPRQMPRSSYEDKIAALRAQYESERQTARETLRELMWWQQALEMFIAPPPPEDATADAKKPTLSDAILAVFDGNQSLRLRPTQVIERLSERGTLPSALSARQMVRNRLLSMMERRLLRRDDSGYYSLGARGVEKLASDQRRAEP